MPPSNAASSTIPDSRDERRPSPRSTASPRCASRISCLERERARHPRTGPYVHGRSGGSGIVRAPLSRERRGAGRATGGSRRSARRATFSRGLPKARRSTIIRAAWSCPDSSTPISTIRRPRSSAPTARSCSTGCTTTRSSRSRNSPIPDHCARIAEFFLDELIRCGTTTAMVYCTVHPQSVDAFFAASERRGARMIAGKTMMDRDAPEALMDTAQRGYDESKALIERWRGRGRLDYAVTPRFAVTSSKAQLEAAGALAREFPASLRPDPSRREQGRDRARGQALSGRAKLPRRL